MNTPHPIQPLEAPSLQELRAHRTEILQIAAEHGARNVRVFGSVARGQARPDSDVDLLVDLHTDKTGLAYFALLQDLEDSLQELLGRKVDVGTDVKRVSVKSVERDLVPL